MIPKTTILLLVIVLTLTLIGSAIAGQHTNDLLPEDGTFSADAPDPYHLALRDRLLQHHFRLCQMLVIP